MKHSKRCGECGSSKIRTTTVSAGGGYSPDLLPGTHSWFQSGKLEVYVCGDCGNFRFYVPEDELAELLQSRAFRDLT